MAFYFELIIMGLLALMMLLLAFGSIILTIACNRIEKERKIDEGKGTDIHG